MVTMHLLMILISLMILGIITYSFNKNTLSAKTYILWVIIWIFVILLGLFPEISTPFAHILGLGRGLDAIFILAILFLLYLIFKLYNRLEDQTKRMNELITQLALKDNRDNDDN